MNLTMKVNILEAKTRLSELIRAAQAGEEVVIANRGEPAVRLVPVAATERGTHPAGSAAAILAWLAANRLPASSRRTPEQIDADIQVLRDDWD
jgi:prevent-host-death family protein